MHRLRQGFSGLRPRRKPTGDCLDQLSPAARAAFSRLSRYDQTHLCAVHDHIVELGFTNTDLLTAALLHDLGKAALGARVRMLDRTLNVLLAAAAPTVHRQLTRLPARRWRLGLALAAHHPTLGAEWARELGCTERVCWLIAHHADDPMPNDDELKLLAAADRFA